MDTAAAPQSASLRLLKLPEVESTVGIRRSSIYSFVARGKFPKPVRTGANSVGWLSSEIDAWLRARAAERDNAAA